MPIDTSEAQAQPLTRSVAKAFSILESFSERTPHLTFAELSELVDLAPTTLRRLLGTLESLGYVQHDSLGRYRLGYRALSLAPPALAAYEVRTQALPVLDGLSEATGLNTNLGVLQEGRLLYLASVSRNLPRRRYFGVPGRLAAAHSTAIGKVLLAFQRPEDVRGLIERAGGLIQRTPKTISTWEELMTELERVRAQGFAVDDEEAATGGRCVAVPIRDRTGAVVAGISMSGMVWEIEMSRIPELVAILVPQADNLSYKLGYAFATEW